MLQFKHCVQALLKTYPCVCLCVKAEDQKSAGDIKPKQAKEKHDEKKSDSEEGTGSAGKFNTSFTQTRSRQQFYQNAYSRFKPTILNSQPRRDS